MKRSNKKLAVAGGQCGESGETSLARREFKFFGSVTVAHCSTIVEFLVPFEGDGPLYSIVEDAAHDEDFSCHDFTNFRSAGAPHFRLQAQALFRMERRGETMQSRQEDSS